MGSAGLRGGEERAHEEALAIRRKALPADHPDIAASLGNLGNVQLELREYAAAGSATMRRWPSSAGPCPRATPTSLQA